MNTDLEPMPDAVADRSSDIWVNTARGWVCIVGDHGPVRYDHEGELAEARGPLRPVTLSAELAPATPATVVDDEHFVWTRGPDGRWTSPTHWRGRRGGIPWSELADQHGPLLLLGDKPLTEEPA